MPIAASVNMIKNNVNADNAVVQTTIWPANSSSWPICAAIGALDTAIGVANKATRIAYSVAPHPNCLPKK